VLRATLGIFQAPLIGPSFMVILTCILLFMRRCPTAPVFRYLSCDTVSCSLVLLTVYLTFIIMVAHFTPPFKKALHALFVLLLLGLLGTFSTPGTLTFYFFFEWSLIPIFLILMGWGYQPERLVAGLALLLYTLFASLPILLIIIKVFFECYTTQFYVLTTLANLSFVRRNKYVFIFLVLAFLVKFPIFLFHLWLPKAHVEAPVSGSIILAGILLKLGGYGLIRFCRLLSISASSEGFISVTLLGGGALGVLCLSQRDMKVVIAYSSVVHISLVIVGFLALLGWGIEGGIIIIIAHGACSSGMFAGANIIYERSHSRRYFINRGNLVFSPLFSLLWLILVVANFGGPFTYNLLGEILLIINLGSICYFLLLRVCLLSFFSAAYRLVLYSSTQQGQTNNVGLHLLPVNTREVTAIVSHCWPLFIIPLNSIIT